MLHEKHGYAIEDLAAKVGKSKAYVYARLKLTALQGEARKAFQDGRLEASVALLVARIPGKDLQAQATRELTTSGVMELDLTPKLGAKPETPVELPEGEIGGHRWGTPGIALPYREAAALIQSRYMLQLKAAPFDVKDPDLVKAAGPCGSCPKRTGNQPELFGDVKSADVCTDPACFAAKKAAHLDQARAAAEAAGRKVIAGKAAEKIFRYPGSLEAAHGSGYVTLDQKTWEYSPLNGNARSWRALVGKHLPEAPTLVQTSDGRLVEVVPQKQLNAAIKAAKLKKPRTAGTSSAYEARARKEQKRRTAVRVAATTALLEAFEKKGKLEDLVAIAAWSLALHGAGTDEKREAAKRRGLEFSAAVSGKGPSVHTVWRGWCRDRMEPPLPGKAAGAKALRELAGWVLEVAITEGGFYGGSGITESMRHAAQLLDVDLKAVQRRALATENGATARVKPGTSRARTAAAKPQPGTCRKCGCTDDKACPGGCVWVDEDETLCSRCAGDEKTAAGKAAKSARTAARAAAATKTRARKGARSKKAKR
jgi:hypothetical protein